MVHMIGNADEFWRLRLTRLDTTENFDFEWHDDILYRRPNVAHGDEVELWHVEAVRLDDANSVSRLGTFDSQAEARDFMSAITENLAEMTKTEFEVAYVDAAELGDTGLGDTELD
jgi:hypothetical protein